MITLGELIRNYREEHDLSLRDFAERCGVSHSYVDKLEKGIDPRSGKPVEPTLDILEKLASAMNLTLDQLLTQIGKINTENNKNTDSVPNMVHSIMYNLNKKDERDVEKIINHTIGMLDPKVELMLNGEILDEEDLELLKQAIRNGLEYAKISNKKRFTPKKYRK
jgi:Helix-turn-helix.